MINVIPTQRTKSRTFGWVQDPSDFRSLCDVVAIFDNQSEKHGELKNLTIPRIVLECDGRQRLIDALDAEPLRISYSNLVGTGFTPRDSARCNGIVQAAVKGQKRKFISDWPADNFVRWAHALGFIEYHYEDDTFSITSLGIDLTEARSTGKEINQGEHEILTTAMLAYPPAVRILKLLAQNEDTHLTKYEIGRELGFVGEDGFTSLPQSVLIKALALEPSANEKNKMKIDWDGSSDKYARMISKWLTELGLVEQVPKQVTVNIAGNEYTETIGQAYMITAAGIVALKRTEGRSRYKRIRKNVYFEMLATKGKDREFLRTRRAFVLKAISELGREICAEEIADYLGNEGINASVEAVRDDVQGLINIGLNIANVNGEYLWCDSINDFILPLQPTLTRSDLTEMKDEVRKELTDLSHEYLALIDLAYDSKQNRLFEMKTVELLMDGCDYQGAHLGGSRKPDGVCYTDDMADNYGIIIDSKAYSNGYSLPIAQADEMERYVRENQTRNLAINPNAWWEQFPRNISKFYFMFVSGHFKGNYLNQLDRISRSTGVLGAAIDIKKLLLVANDYKAGNIQHGEIETEFFK